jgi:signal transduction histidine kinase
MSASFFGGVLCAWTIAQLALGVFFVLAHTLGRREIEYLLFGLVCLALSVTTSGIALPYIFDSQQVKLAAARLSFDGALAAAALNLHFVICYAALRVPRWLVALGYGAAALGGLLSFSTLVMSPDSVVTIRSRVFGVDIEQVSMLLTPFSRGFAGLGVVELFAAPVLLFLAWRSGKREAWSSLLGAMVVCAAVANDLGLALPIDWNTIYLLPHAFLVYAFAVASTLLVRYRRTAGELEQMVERLRESTQKLELSHEELKVMQAELVKKQQLAAVGELAAAIAHEVRNPLAVIVNAVAGLRRPRIPDEDRHMLLGIVDEETARLNRLVTDLLRFARPVSLKRSAVSLVELARRSQAACRDDHKVDVTIDDDVDVQTIWVDPGLFRVVFDNLVDNACQAMPAGGTVTIRAKRTQTDGKPAVSIEIRDTGRGMEAEVLERAVDPFFTTRPSGTGLGLPIVHRILEAHGGELSIETEPGQGTKVTMLLPMASRPDSDPEGLRLSR